MRLRTASPLLLLIVLGCVTPGQDVALVSAERTQQISLDVVQSLWRIDNDNRQTMREQLPDVHKWVEQSRTEFPTTYQQLDDAVAAYRAARTAANQQVMNTALEKVEELARVARRYLAQAHSKGITAKTRTP